MRTKALALATLVAPLEGTSGAMSSMLNTEQDRKCYRVSAQDAQGSFQPVQLLMSPSKAEYNVKEVLDWRAATRDDFKGMVYHPSNPVTDVTTAWSDDMTHRPLLLAIKDTGAGDGSVMLTACDVWYGMGSNNQMGRFYMNSQCAKHGDETWDSWHETTTCPAHTGDPNSANNYIGFYWAPTELRTGVHVPHAVSNPMGPVTVDRATWTPTEVATGVFTLKNKLRGLSAGFEYGKISLLPTGEGRFKFEEVLPPAGVYTRPIVERSCCNADGCACTIANSVSHESSKAIEADFDRTDRSRNDAEETIKTWAWDGSSWSTVQFPVQVQGVQDGKPIDSWQQGSGSTSHTSSTIELGTSRSCRYAEDYGNDYDCLLSDLATKAPTDNGQWGDMREVKIAGLRFTGLSVPKGAKITEARIRFTSRRDDNGPVSLKISTEVGHFPRHLGWGSDAGADTKIYPRATTAENAGSLAWQITEPWFKYSTYDTPDLSALVQKAVDAGEDLDTLAFFLHPQDVSTDNMNRRSPYSFKSQEQGRDGGRAKAAELVLKWGTGDAGEPVTTTTTTTQVAPSSAQPVVKRSCCSAMQLECVCTIANSVSHESSKAIEADFDRTDRSRNDAEETIKTWAWDGSSWSTVQFPVQVQGVQDGKPIDSWQQGSGSTSHTSSTIELGTSRSCRYAEDYGNDYDCLLSDLATKAPTDNGQWGDMREVKIAGLRFTGLSVPKGAKITEARIRFTSRRDDNGPVSLKISTEVGHFPRHLGWGSDAGADTKIYPRATTAENAGSLAWQITEPWFKYSTYDTPDLSALVQKAVDAGEDLDTLAFFLHPQDVSTDNMNRRSPYSFKSQEEGRDGGRAKAAELVLKWEAGVDAAAAAAAAAANVMAPLLNSHKDCPVADADACPRARCFSMSVLNKEADTYQPVLLDMTKAKPEWGVKKVKDWRADVPDAFESNPPFYPGQVRTSDKDPWEAGTPAATTALFAFKDAGYGDGSVMLDSCDYMAGDGTWAGRTAFTLIGVCADQTQDDAWHSTSCLPDTAVNGRCDWPSCHSGVGFYWAPTALRTELAPTTGTWGNPMSPQLKARATWIPTEVSPGVFTFRNKYRNTMFLGEPAGGFVGLQYTAGQFMFTEVTKPAGVYVTPTPAPPAAQLAATQCTHTKCVAEQLGDDDASGIVIRVTHHNSEARCAKQHCGIIKDAAHPRHDECECHMEGFHPNGNDAIAPHPNGLVNPTPNAYGSATAVAQNHADKLAGANPFHSKAAHDAAVAKSFSPATYDQAEMVRDGVTYAAHDGHVHVGP